MMKARKFPTAQKVSLFGDELTDLKPKATKQFGDKKRVRMSAPAALSGLLAGYEKPMVNKYVSREFQDYGYRLACEMGEEQRKSMYIRLAKTVNRSILEQARRYVLDAPEVRSKGRLFIWAVGKLKKGERLGGDGRLS